MDAIIIPILATPVIAVLAFFVRHYVTLQQAANTAIRGDRVDDAKDELIETLERNHEALVDRVGLLERRAAGLDEKLSDAYAAAEDLRVKLAGTLDRYNELAKYAAPEAVKTLTAMLDAFSHTTNALLVDLLERLTAVEKQQNSGLESLAHALDLLRQATVVARSE